MQSKSIDISKWILLLTFSQVSGFIILHLNDINEKRLPDDSIKDSNIQDEAFQNIDYKISNIDSELQHVVKNIDPRISEDVTDFTHKRLVKRIVPHGYEVKDFEYDDKFKTLFKPLVRIHKKKPDPDFNDDEDSYDLIYAFNDKRFEDKAYSDNDNDDLLKPFTVDNIDIKYMPSDNGVEYIIDRDGTFLDDSRPNNQFGEFGQSRYKLIDNMDQIKAKKNPNNVISIDIDDDKLKQVVIGDWIEYDQKPTNSKHIYELINKIAKFKLNKNNQLRKPKYEKPQRFISIEQSLSKLFKPEPNIGRPDENVVRSFELKYVPNKYTNNLKYRNFLDQLQQTNQNQNKEMYMKREIQPLGWFGPVGVINSKQFIKTDENDNAIKSKSNKNKLRYYQPETQHWLGPLKPEIQEQQTFEEDQPIDPKPMHNYIRGMFGPVGHMNSKHITHYDWRHETESTKRPYYYIEPEDFSQNDNEYPGSMETKSNKFSLLNEIAQLKVNNLHNERMEQLKERELNVLEELRSHLKSGEDEETIKKERDKFDYLDMPQTEKPSKQKPKYPFWNEWTYGKQILEDNCKGQLVQHGRVCVGAFA